MCTVQRLIGSGVKRWSESRRTAARRWSLFRGAILLLLAAFSATSCVRTRTVTVPIPVAALPLMDEPPPLDGFPLLDVPLIVDGSNGCPRHFVCLTPEAAVSLAVMIGYARAWRGKARTWMLEAWGRIGARTATPAPSSGSGFPPLPNLAGVGTAPAPGAGSFGGKP